MPPTPLQETLWQDRVLPCPYLPGRAARLPLRFPDRRLTAVELDAALEKGDRRTGVLLYRPACPGCTACRSLRVRVDDFEPSRDQRRASNRCRDVRVVIGTPGVSPERVALFNRHRVERGLDQGTDAEDPQTYRQGFVRSCAPTVEMSYRLGDRLVGVGLVDVGAVALSSVYFYWDPDEARRGLGTWSVLQEVALARRLGCRFLYLGFFVEGCLPMTYKARYRPHERLVDGVWRQIT